MLPLRDFWSRHKRKVVVAASILGSGYFCYKLYEAHRRRIADLKKELATERENDERLKAHMQGHFENIQRIADTTTLPHAIHDLSSQIAEELDLSLLTERLMRGKDQPNTLTTAEKLQLWDQLKILSFTKMASSLWAMTLVTLYVRIQANILGRHLYIDTARGLVGSQILDEAGLIDMEDQRKFLASADYLSNHGMPMLIQDMQAAATEVLEGKQLMEVFNSSLLHETVMQILNTFMSKGSPHHWVGYLMSEDLRHHGTTSMPNNDDGIVPDVTKFDQLMLEALAVLSSSEFGSIIDLSLKIVVNAIVEDVEVQAGENTLSSGIPLAKLLPRVATIGPLLLEEPGQNRFLQTIQNAPEVELFFTLLYANVPSSQS